MATLYRHERMDGILQERLKQQVHSKIQRRRGRVLAKTPKLQSIKPLERQYFKAIDGIVQTLKRLTREILIPELDNLVKEAKSLRPTQDSGSHRTDNYSDVLTRIMELLRVQYLREFPDVRIVNIAVKTAQIVDDFNAKQINRTLKQVLGVDYSRFEPWITQEIKGFTTANVKLISSIPDQYFDKVEGIVLRGAQSGKLSKDIASDIIEQFGVTERRAALIARDQVSKFNGNLNQLRQQNIGVTKYRWSTSGDERVRPEHEELDGEIFEWSDPPEVGHPGQDFQCRCSAIPVFEGFE